MTAVPYHTGDTIDVRFESLASSGACKGTPAHAPGTMNVFADDVLPGETAAVQLTKVDKRYAEGRVLERRGDAPERVTPPCPVFGICGGCRWQHLEIEAQRAAKLDIVGYVLRRAGIETPVSFSDDPSPAYGYRGRAEIAVEKTGSRVRVGFRARASRDIVETGACPILRPALERALPMLADAVRERPAWEGERRARLILDGAGARAALVAEENRGEPTPPVLVFDTETGAVVEAAAGLRFSLSATFPPLSFSPGVFTQVNPFANSALVAAAVRSAGNVEGTRVLDLYAGIGNFSLPLALVGARVTAVESDAGAVRDARVNAATLEKEAAPGGTQRGRLRVVGEDVSRVLARMDREGEKFDVVVADPPRPGLSRRVVEAIVRREPRRVVYVSCNPESLAHDLRIFTRSSYGVRSVTAFDMFPQTPHIETLTLLDRE